MMNRAEFMKILRSELRRLPEDERNSALEYYEEYFDEAGPQKEQQVLENLGNPKKIAGQIKADYAMQQLDQEEMPTAKKGWSACAMRLPRTAIPRTERYAPIRNFPAQMGMIRRNCFFSVKSSSRNSSGSSSAWIMLCRKPRQMVSSGERERFCGSACGIAPMHMRINVRIRCCSVPAPGCPVKRCTGRPGQSEPPPGIFRKRAAQCPVTWTGGGQRRCRLV